MIASGELLADGACSETGKPEPVPRAAGLRLVLSSTRPGPALPRDFLIGAGAAG